MGRVGAERGRAGHAVARGAADDGHGRARAGDGLVELHAVAAAAGLRRAAGRVWRVSDGHAVWVFCAHAVGLADAVGGRRLRAAYAERAGGCDAGGAGERDDAPERGGGA